MALPLLELVEYNKELLGRLNATKSKKKQFLFAWKKKFGFVL
jgi:hypothetical protein